MYALQYFPIKLRRCDSASAQKCIGGCFHCVALYPWYPWRCGRESGTDLHQRVFANQYIHEFCKQRRRSVSNRSLWFYRLPFPLWWRDCIGALSQRLSFTVDSKLWNVHIYAINLVLVLSSKDELTIWVPLGFSKALKQETLV